MWAMNMVKTGVLCLYSTRACSNSDKVDVTVAVVPDSFGQRINGLGKQGQVGSVDDLSV